MEGPREFDAACVIYTSGTTGPSKGVLVPWGTLTADEGVLIAPDFKTAWVGAPTSADLLSGPGWTLKLNAGWKIVPASRKGDFTLTK